MCPTLKTDFAIQENKLVVQIHEKDHDDRDPDYKRRRQKELEKLGYYIVRINPDKPNFDEYEKFGRVQKYIKNSTEKSLIKDPLKKFLEPNHSIKAKCLKWVVKKLLSTI